MVASKEISRNALVLGVWIEAEKRRTGSPSEDEPQLDLDLPSGEAQGE
jgi:hypothetical protein